MSSELEQADMRHQDHSAGALDPIRVICFHSSTASGGQWTSLDPALGSDYVVVAPDLYGYGDAPGWHAQRALRLVDEVCRVEDLIPTGGSGVHLVGHSYGGAVALRAALRNPDRVCSVTVYEPVLFGLLERASPGGESCREIWHVAGEVFACIADGDMHAAARVFIDYWGGTGSWASLPHWQQNAITARIGKTAHDFSACFDDPMTLDELRELPMPVLCLHGGHAPRTTREISSLLVEEAGFTGRCLPTAGHLGPMTHGEEVNDLIVSFITSRVAATLACSGAGSIERNMGRQSDHEQEQAR
jgi:pimeloyl-ACP methyl ester carboxylesterase